jgi:hypothetical protein
MPIIRITLDVNTTLDPGPAFELAHSQLEDLLDIRAGTRA